MKKNLKKVRRWKMEDGRWNPDVSGLLQAFCFPLIVFATLLSLPCKAQLDLTNDTANDEISTMTLEEIMKNKSQANPSLLESKLGTQTEVASLSTPLVSRRTPGIVSIITEDDITRSGARDLIDILNMIPGIEFNVDEKGIIGISMRGNWANEGKVLLLMDGQELNETLFGTIAFGNRYPVDQIKKIEIIRGPGSAIYGGAAEYAVINIITKNATDINGVQANVVYGQTATANARNNYTIALGRKINDLSFSLACFMGNSNQGDKNYTDVHGNTYNMADNSTDQSRSFNFGMAFKGLSLRAISDYYYNETRDGYDLISKETYHQYFQTFAAELKYDWKPFKTLSVTPKINVKINSPWEISTTSGTDSAALDAFYKVRAHRYTSSGLTSVWQPGKDISLTFGEEEYYDRAVREDIGIFQNAQSTEVAFTNVAAFAQGLYKNGIADITLGSRYDYDSSYGSSFVPRLGLTKRIDAFNFKLLYSSAFKAPTIENIETALNGPLRPEKTNIWEVQGGYQLSPNMFLTVNLFDIHTDNTIVFYSYRSDTATAIPVSGYINSDQTGSRGIEMEYKYETKAGFLNIGYSYYSTLDKPSDSLYTDPYSSSQALGISNHKLTINGSLNISNNFYLSPGFTWRSAKTAITGTDAEGNYTYQRLPPTSMINLIFGFQPMHSGIFKSLSGSIGVYNLLNENFTYAQAYASGHAPLPADSREFLVRLNYKLFSRK